MHAITTHDHPHGPRSPWRHALQHARARLSDLRMRTTLGPTGTMDAAAGRPMRRDHPFWVDR